MSFSFADLPWLLPAPQDFTARRRALVGLDDTAFAVEAARLAAFKLSSAQAAALGKEIGARLQAGRPLPGLEPLTLAVLSGATADLLVEQFPAAAARHGVALRVVASGYDQVEQAALQPNGLTAASRPDATLIAVDHRWLRLDRPSLADPGGPATAMARLERVIGGLAENGGGAPIVCTVPAPPETLFGSLDAVQPGAVAASVCAFNESLKGRAAGWGASVLDVAALAARVGLDAWFDPVARHTAKLAFAPVFDPAYADVLGRLLGAIRGRSRKALVLDLDNTLWGGVLGDDGVDALALGPGDPMGEAFAAIQDFALDLHRRGVFLALSSKNDDALARRAFATRAGMKLSLDHIAVFQANWNDKPSNLVAIAEALNVGTDALVFLDDNPAERAQVRAALPEVAVPELPADPGFFVRHLAAAGYFEAAAFSTDDAARAKGFLAHAKRAEVKRTAGDLGDYLADLKMVLTLRRFDAAGRSRIAQLINKTNQFNLTGRRYTEAEVAAFEDNPGVVTLQAHLEDRFGDMGTISALIARETAHGGERALQIDTWVLSCRVFGRGVEDALFSALLDAARARSARWITATFVPGSKSAPVADLLPRLGFEAAPPSDLGFSHRLSVAAAATPRTMITVRAEP